MEFRKTTTGFNTTQAKTVHYFSNGTGRDFYIAHNSGGLIANKDVLTAFDLGTVAN